MKIIAQGAEAIVYDAGDCIVKERIPKKYRIPELDTKIIKSRNKKEVKILLFLQEHKLNVPKFIKVELNKIFMEKIDGSPLKNILDDNNYKELMKEVGYMVATIHNLDVIHGDLTTLNFLINKKVYLIDFGLSFNSSKDEDKAVDLYVFERAIMCGHKEGYLTPFYESYLENGSQSVMKKLESVRLRGRKREEEALN